MKSKFIPACLLLAAASAAQAEDNAKFIGYFRSTLGTSDGGDAMVSFGAPGSRAKYRLGNEPDTVFEAGVDYRLPQPANAPAGSYLQTVFMLNGYAGIGNSSKLSSADIIQAYVKLSRYVGDFDLWAGRRYYQRQQININDYFWLNTAQGAHIGAGLEDWALGAGKLDIATFGYEDQDVSSLVTTDVKKTLHSRMVEVRYRDIALSDSLKLHTFVSYTARPSDEVLGFEAADGTSAAAWLDMNFGSSKNTVAAIYRQGLGIVQGGADARPIRESSRASSGAVSNSWDLDKAKVLQVHDSYTLYGDGYGIEFLALTYSEENGLDNGKKVKWNSVGIRPSYNLTPYLSLVGEVGTDMVKIEETDGTGKVTDLDGDLTKGTVALVVTTGQPAIKFFVTKAQWSDDFKGEVGKPTYANKTSGWTGGVQTEVWW